MSNIFEIIKYFFAVILGLIVFIVSIPIIGLTFPFSYFSRRNFEKKYHDFLIENDNKNFFCYNNRRNSKDYIENSIVPQLVKDIEIVYLDGKNIVSNNFPKQFISNALYRLENYSKFPHLMKIRNGKIIDKSINSRLYTIKNQNKSTDMLLREINDFFELN